MKQQKNMFQMKEQDNPRRKTKRSGDKQIYPIKSSSNDNKDAQEIQEKNE